MCRVGWMAATPPVQDSSNWSTVLEDNAYVYDGSKCVL